MCPLRYLLLWSRFRFLVSLAKIGLGGAAALLTLSGWDAAARTRAAAAETDGLFSRDLDVVMTTSDGLRLAATYYAGSKGKDTVPIVLLHGLRGSRKDYVGLARALQNQGHAVVVPDLRGHGDSLIRRDGKPLNAPKLSESDYQRMVSMDVPRILEFLIQQNNAGELNVEKLCVVGADMGASVALIWSYVNWLHPPAQGKKRGQDVKAVVAISPKDIPGLPLKLMMEGQPIRVRVDFPELRRVFKEPETIDFRLPVALDFRREGSFLLVVGKNPSDSLQAARKLHQVLKKLHPEPRDEDRLAKQDLFYGEFKTKLQGIDLFKENPNLEQMIVRFIELRLVKQPYPWAERVDPLRD